jgi:hypothetical protein
MSKDKRILGHVESIDIPTLGVTGVLAKVDTGAFSGALHCSDIVISDDGKSLSFNPLGKRKLRITVNNFKKRYVRSTNGEREQRFVIPVELSIQGSTYSTMISLADRTQMGFEILIGRRLLREHSMLVDVAVNGEYDKEWKAI